MTNKEAKDYIREWCPYDKQDEIIKVLSNSDEDCISRQGAIDALGYDISIESDKGIDAYRTVIKEILCKIYDVQKAQIDALPSIQPNPKTDVLDKIKEEIKENTYFINEITEKEGIDFETVEKIIDKYKAESEDKE